MHRDVRLARPNLGVNGHAVTVVGDAVIGKVAWLVHPLRLVVHIEVLRGLHTEGILAWILRTNRIRLVIAKKGWINDTQFLVLDPWSHGLPAVNPATSSQVLNNHEVATWLLHHGSLRLLDRPQELTRRNAQSLPINQ